MEGVEGVRVSLSLSLSIELNEAEGREASLLVYIRKGLPLSLLTKPLPRQQSSDLVPGTWHSSTTSQHSKT